VRTLARTSNLLALDLATCTGYCIGAADDVPMIGHVDLAPGRPHAERGAALIDWIDEIVDLYAPGCIVFESPLVASRQTSVAQNRLAHGLVMAASLIAFRRSIWCMEAGVGQARKIAFGRGSVTKDQVFARCREAGFDPQNTDESDAWCLWRATWRSRGLF
jgi:Holliday junction resolvasome RuvABC endonuclease subunit